MCIETTWLEKDWVPAVSVWLAISIFHSCLAVSGWSDSEADRFSLMMLPPFAIAAREAEKVQVTYDVLCKWNVLKLNAILQF